MWSFFDILSRHNSGIVQYKLLVLMVSVKYMWREYIFHSGILNGIIHVRIVIIIYYNS